MTATLAIDLGGTKVLAALVKAGRILERAEVPTDRNANPSVWLEQISTLVIPWAGQYKNLGITVTGRVSDGLWSAVNPQTLGVPESFPFFDTAKQALGLTPVLANDAQAAAWGEYTFGAARDRDVVFLTVSTGIGGGIVLGGKLLTGRSGLAGHFGQIASLFGSQCLEDDASGRWIAAEAERAGQPMDARGVFAAAAVGHGWADRIIATSAERLATLCQSIQLMLDPDVIVIGGGVGLADGYLDRITSHLETLPSHFRPTLARAALGADAGAIGIAALANTKREQ
ncbi:MAG: ROK family protein [Pseudomonadota bacterium]